MLYEVEIDPVNPIASRDVLDACGKKADVVSFKVEEDQDKVKYHLQFRDKVDKNHVDSVLEGIEKLGCSVNLQGIKKNDLGEESLKGDKERSKKTQSTVSSERSLPLRTRAKSASKLTGPPYWIRKQISTNQYQNFNYYSKQDDALSHASDGVAQKVGVTKRGAVVKNQNKPSFDPPLHPAGVIDLGQIDNESFSRRRCE